MTTDHGGNPHRGSSLDDPLHAEATAALNRAIAWRMRDRTPSKVAMARMGAPRSRRDRVLDPEDGTVTIDTPQRAAGRPLRFERV